MIPIVGHPFYSFKILYRALFSKDYNTEKKNFISIFEVIHAMFHCFYTKYHLYYTATYSCNLAAVKGSRKLKSRPNSLL